MKVNKGLIPAAGSGSRLGPFTKAIPKELLPVGDKATIEHVVEAMSLAGIEEVVIVISPHKHGLSDYLGSGKRLGVRLTYVVQDERRGLADAVLAGEHVLKGPFAVVLGDNFFTPNTFLSDLISYHIECNADATLGVVEVDDVSRYGIIDVEGGRVVDMIEKPTQSQAPSKLGSIGAYVFQECIFDAIRKTQPGHMGEYQLTDSIKILIGEKKRVIYRKVNGIHIDVGTPQDLMRANACYMNLIDD
ncbi:MAG TPA: sugar phosphate nucleotidyltransferase [Methanothrix soehngenii]|jgi:dTDP-glucose pyrophosphorylase|uniref:sugar phosphate nucleotidyltransferase n=1 Tax=Methanothrix soehngenii TaxID=2223 RepID=UPI002BB05C49|nr:sugar phosphate nucleotidyltransferase [Methanothrix soehngenii]HOI20117.1 sugar phosphate nucleotidyltransferase [Methanothrix soehngenii]